MYKIVYEVQLPGESIDFESEKEAIKFAEEHCEEHPVVRALDLELNDFGEVVDENDSEVIWTCDDEEDFEDSVVCSWCNEEQPKSDCRLEQDLGWLCPQCQEAIKSRGEQLVFIENDLDEYFDGCCVAQDDRSTVKPAENAVVDCPVNPVIAHSEDEKPLDCKMEKAPLEKPLVEEDEMEENVNINVSADRPEELVSLAKALLGDDFAAFDQDFDAPVEVIPPAELGAGFEVRPDAEEVEYVDPFEKNPFDDAPVEPEGAEEISEPAGDPEPFEEPDPEPTKDPDPEIQDGDAEEEISEEDPEEEPVETEMDKEMEAKADERSADEQPMDMIDGKLVPAKDPKESEVEVDESLEEGAVGAAAAIGAGAKFIADHKDEIINGLKELGVAANDIDKNIVDILKRHQELKGAELKEESEGFSDFDTQIQPEEFADDLIDPDELSDEEFLEKFGKALAEKRCGK